LPGGSITFGKEGHSRIEISKSVFIGDSIEVRTLEEAEGFVAGIRSEYPDARHVCYAWRIAGETFMQKYSDDGEPSGTGGMPILNVLLKKDISNAVITVTRYFGGILLGKGGLVRAYTDAACAAAEDSGLVTVNEGLIFGLSSGYDRSEKIIRAINEKGFNVGDPVYGENVDIRVTVAKDREQEFCALITDISCGKIVPRKMGKAELREALPQI
jgi:uncharacterized YigZ family protein